jgi:sugar-specific transcriptional regulator TrmB
MKSTPLEEMGLTRNESKIYLTLLQYGSSTAGEITNKTGIHRRSVYDSLERLLEKGLVSHILKENRKFFQPTNPNHLIEMLRRREEDVLNILPELQSMYQHSEKEEIVVLKGREGARAVYEDILKTGKDYYAIATGKIPEIVGPKTYEKYIQERVEKGIHLHTIYEESMRGSMQARRPNARCRFMPKGFVSPINVVQYGDKLEIIVWSYDPATPLIILIKNRKIAEAFKSYFNMLWKTAKK